MKLWEVEVTMKSTEVVMVYAESWTDAEREALKEVCGDEATAHEVVESSQIPESWRGITPLGEDVDGKTCGEWAEDLDARQWMREHQLVLPFRLKGASLQTAGPHRTH